MAAQALITRRGFLSAVPPALVIGTTVAAPAVVEAATSKPTIPPEIIQKLEEALAVNKASKAANKAYSAALQAKPVNKSECKRLGDAFFKLNIRSGKVSGQLMRMIWDQ